MSEVRSLAQVRIFSTKSASLYMWCEVTSCQKEHWQGGSRLSTSRSCESPNGDRCARKLRGSRRFHPRPLSSSTLFLFSILIFVYNLGSSSRCDLSAFLCYQHHTHTVNEWWFDIQIKFFIKHFIFAFFHLLQGLKDFLYSFVFHSWSKFMFYCQ